MTWMRPDDEQLQMSRQKMNGGHMTLQKPAGTDKSARMDHQRPNIEDNLWRKWRETKVASVLLTSWWFHKNKTMLCFHCNFSLQFCFFFFCSFFLSLTCSLAVCDGEAAHEWQWPSYRMFWNALVITLNSF